MCTYIHNETYKVSSSKFRCCCCCFLIHAVYKMLSHYAVVDETSNETIYFFFPASTVPMSVPLCLPLFLSTLSTPPYSAPSYSPIFFPFIFFFFFFYFDIPAHLLCALYSSIFGKNKYLNCVCTPFGKRSTHTRHKRSHPEPHSAWH